MAVGPNFAPMRNTRLDVLRCLAVLLVILNHGRVSEFFTRTGWAGVDLFFVLSGFLISGLLFSEYQKRGKISLKRFFIRRGLKIYPAFYVFLGLTALISYRVLHQSLPLNPYLHEIFFLQNYGHQFWGHTWAHGVWGHTWSLAVEEHFYIFLPVFFLGLVRFSSNRQDPFRAIPWACLAIGVFCLAARAVSVYVGTPDFKMAYAASHERMDALFFGVFLGYLHHFRPLMLPALVEPVRNRVMIAAAAVVLLAFAYLLPRENCFLATWGYTFMYLGFGGVLVLSLYVRGLLPGAINGMARTLGRGLAFVGMYSYSIYLWHWPCDTWLPGLVLRALHLPTGPCWRFAVYFPGCLVVGIVMSRLIEYPILHLRDRIFPAVQAGPVLAGAPAKTEDAPRLGAVPEPGSVP